MPEQRFTVETVKRIYDDKDPNNWIEIGPDADTGDLLEIRSMSFNEITRKGDITQRIAIVPESIDTFIHVLESFKPR